MESAAIAGALFFFVVCALCVYYLVVWSLMWVQVLISEWVQVVNCSWRATFWACVSGLVYTLVESLLWMWITYLALQIVFVNMIALA